MMELQLVVTGKDLKKPEAAMLEAMAAEYSRSFALVVQKTEGYGDAWKHQGWMGNVARILSKSARLKSLLWRDIAISGHDETIEDTARDLMNLCVFFLLNRGQDNKWGRRS